MLGPPEPTERYYRKVIRIRAEDSPNVQARRDDVFPGVLTWSEYRKRRATWDRVRQCIGLDGEFYLGPEALLFPPEWLNRAERLWEELRSSGRRRAGLGVGVDPGEGTAETSMAVVDRWGVVEVVARPTPDTSVIRREIVAFYRRWGVPAERVFLDRGGGGKQIADELRAAGHAVRTVAFGESVQLPVKKGQHFLSDRRGVAETRYTYKNRRAQMYGELSAAMDPAGGWEQGFALPPDDAELRRQLAVLPKLYDEEGRLWLPPKNKRDDKDTRKTLTELLGCSPDRADSLALAFYAMTAKDLAPKIEVM